MNFIKDLWERRWDTDLGSYFPGERVVLHGKDLFSDLEDWDWMALLIYGICGRRPDFKQVKLLNAIWTYCPNYPDPRLWNIRIGTLAGVARSTGVLGVSAGLAVSEATVYGPATMIRASRLLHEIKARCDNGEPLESLLREKILTRPLRNRPASGKKRETSVICGFGRPVSKREERIRPLMKVVKELGFDKMPMVSLAFAIEAKFFEMGLKNMFVNAGGLVAALFCDQGFSLREQYYLCIMQHGAGISFCAMDAERHPEGSFFPPRCNRIACQDQSVRQWHVQ